MILSFALNVSSEVEYLNYRVDLLLIFWKKKSLYCLLQYPYELSWAFSSCICLPFVFPLLKLPMKSTVCFLSGYLLSLLSSSHILDINPILDAVCKYFSHHAGCQFILVFIFIYLIYLCFWCREAFCLAVILFIHFYCYCLCF